MIPLKYYVRNVEMSFALVHQGHVNELKFPTLSLQEVTTSTPKHSTQILISSESAIKLDPINFWSL